MIRKKARRLPAKDPFLLTEMPLIDFNKEWFPDIHITYNGEKESGLFNEQLQDIAHVHIAEGNALLAASLWYPWDHEGGAMYIESSKLISHLPRVAYYVKKSDNHSLLIEL